MVELDLADLDQVEGCATTLLAARVVVVSSGEARGGQLSPHTTVSKVVTSLLLPSAASGAQSTLRALDPRTPGGAFVGPSGFAQLRGHPELLDVYASAKDPAIAARLWELTEEVLEVPLPV